jgi:membrane protein required for colicin V production
MFIDILVAIALVFATVKGIRNGLIIAVFSILAFIIGLAAALKLSTVVASWLAQSTNINVQWLPFLAFALVFLLVVLAVRSVAKLIEKAMDLAWMGWLNKLGGVLICLYVPAYFKCVVFLWYTAETDNRRSKNNICCIYIYCTGRAKSYRDDWCSNTHLQ